MDSVTGIMPEALIKRNARKDARAWIIAQPWPDYVKRQAMFAWARTVGVRMTAKEMDMVIASGHTGSANTGDDTDGNS